MDFVQSHLLTLVIFAPLVGAAIIAFLPREEGGQHKGVALLLILLTTFLGPIVFLSSWKYIQTRVKLYCASLLLLETAMIGTLAALDLVLFYVFWEAMLIPMYLLIGMWGSERRIYAAVKFFLFTFVGSVLMLLAIFWLWSHSAPPGQPRT